MPTERKRHLRLVKPQPADGEARHADETILPTRSLEQLKSLLERELKDKPETLETAYGLLEEGVRELFQESYEKFCPVFVPYEDPDYGPTLGLGMHPGVIRDDNAPTGTYDIFEILDVSLEDLIVSTENEPERQAIMREMLIYTAQMLAEASGAASHYARSLDQPGFIEDFMGSLRD